MSTNVTPEIRQRAKSPEQKALRRQQILDAAAEYFSTSAFDKVSLSDIAQRVGITKAALYRYFRSKETLFLALYLQELDGMVATAERVEKQTPAAEACFDVICQHPLFCSLNAILHTVLEQNLTVAEAASFKQALLPIMQRFADKISEWIAVSREQAIIFLKQLQAAMIGCWHISHPSQTVRQALQQPTLDILLIDYQTCLKQHIQWLIMGCMHNRSHSND